MFNYSLNSEYKMMNEVMYTPQCAISTMHFDFICTVHSSIIISMLIVNYSAVIRWQKVDVIVC